MEDYRERLYKLRRRYSLTQKKFAEILGISRQAVSRWETEENEPSSENLDQICSIFHISKDYFLNAEFIPAYLEESYFTSKEGEIAISEAEPADESAAAETETALACETGATEDFACEDETQSKSRRALEVLVTVFGALFFVSCLVTFILGVNITSLHSHAIAKTNYNQNRVFIGSLIISAVLFVGELVLLGLTIRKKWGKSVNVTQKTQEASDLQRESN